MMLVIAMTTTAVGDPVKLPPNRWTRLAVDADGARRLSSFRFVDSLKGFLLWGYLSRDVYTYGGPHAPIADNAETDLVRFDLADGGWRSEIPVGREIWAHDPPPMYPARSYHGITTGSYRSDLRMRDGVFRPDLNIVYDQVTYDSKRDRMVYFSGGNTFFYEVSTRAWSDLPAEGGPPPVLGGSLCYDPVNDEVVLFGGGHVVEEGVEGHPVGHTGTWILDCDNGRWRQLEGALEPPPRMASRLVYDSRNEVMVLFGGDGQSHWLGDTWMYDPATRMWQASQAAAGPGARAGHFSVYDRLTGWVIVGGGHDGEYPEGDLTDMWAFDAGEDSWRPLKGDVPTGWYVTADVDPERSTIVLTTATESPEIQRGCDQIYPVRTTYAFKIDREGLVDGAATVGSTEARVPKRSPADAAIGAEPDAYREALQRSRLASMPGNEWTELVDPVRTAPVRTWGSCAFDSDKGRIVYWGGGHCGYGGNDTDFYDVGANAWRSAPTLPEYPERGWNQGVNLAGVTFRGAPWVRHGRKIYAYDPVSRLIVNTKVIFLTGGYEPEPLAGYPAVDDFVTDRGSTPSGKTVWATWTSDPEKGTWNLLCSGAEGLDLLVSTPHGVMGVDHNWRLADIAARAGSTYGEGEAVKENAVYLLDVAGGEWRKLSTGEFGPQNLYEMTALVYDSRRDQLILHGGGPNRDEVWTFSVDDGAWRKMEPEGLAPVCRREAIYLPEADVMLTFGTPVGNDGEPGAYAYEVAANRWTRVTIAPPRGRDMGEVVGQNRAMTYDAERDLVLMVLGGKGGDRGEAVVYGMRYETER